MKREQTQSSDSEDDYMSDSLLAQISDVRPGVATTAAARRRIELCKYAEEAQEDNKRKQKPRAEIEKERRDEALQKPIDDQSKGVQ